MRICSIASGSSGNCVYVGSDTTHLLVDAGISRKRIEAGLNALELSLKDLDGILITHEHSDHIKGLGVLAGGVAEKAGDSHLCHRRDNSQNETDGLSASYSGGFVSGSAGRRTLYHQGCAGGAHADFP